jgi:hypothetical protein
VREHVLFVMRGELDFGSDNDSCWILTEVLSRRPALCRKFV